MVHFSFSFPSKKITKKQKKMMGKAASKFHAKVIGKIRLDITVLKRDIESAQVSHMILKVGNRKRVFVEDMVMDIEPVPVAEGTDVFRKEEFIRMAEVELKKREEDLREEEVAYAALCDKLQGRKPFERKK